MLPDLSFTCNVCWVYLRLENEAAIHNCLGALCYPNGSWFYSVLCKLGHRCFIAAECFETISYVQWEKKPLKIHAEIIKLFNFTVKLSEQVMNLSLYCLPLHTWLLPLQATESAFLMLLSTPHGGVLFSKVSDSLTQSVSPQSWHWLFCRSLAWTPKDPWTSLSLPHFLSGPDLLKLSVCPRHRFVIFVDVADLSRCYLPHREGETQREAHSGSSWPLILWGLD